MASRTLTFTLGVIGFAASFTAVAEDGLCKPLREFVASVKPNETHVLRFHTSWGSNFKDDKDDEEPVFWAKRCENGGYDPAKAVCDFLMEHGATEFSGNNAKSALSCLSAKSPFAAGMQIHAISVSITVGTENRGALVDVDFAEDTSIGGMVLSITADGY